MKYDMEISLLCVITEPLGFRKSIIYMVNLRARLFTSNRRILPMGSPSATVHMMSTHLNHDNKTPRGVVHFAFSVHSPNLLFHPAVVTFLCCSAGH